MKEFFIAVAFTLLFVDSMHAAVLANEETMLKQLKAVTDDPNMIENYYRFLLAFADYEKGPDGIVSMFNFANGGYKQYVLEKLPIEKRLDQERLLIKNIPELIRAILPDNKDEAEESIKRFNESYLRRDTSASCRDQRANSPLSKELRLVVEIGFVPTSFPGRLGFPFDDTGVAFDISSEKYRHLY